MEIDKYKIQTMSDIELLDEIEKIGALTTGDKLSVHREYILYLRSEALRRMEGRGL